MLAQAEHDVDASAILLTTSREPGGRCGRGSGATASYSADGRRRAAVDRQQRRDRGRRFARACGRVFELARAGASGAARSQHCWRRSRHAGAVFLGPASPEAAGDYASGPNHVLPTSGAARLRGGLSAADFVKVISVQELSPAALKSLAPAITTLARAEGLEAHARSVGGAAWLTPSLRARPSRRWRRILRPPAGRDGKLRLDFNENTVGCSPKVIECVKKYAHRRRT